MKTNEDYKQEILDLSLTKIDLYLKQKGWQKTGEKKGFASVWKINGKETKVMLPLNKEYSDFRDRLWEIILLLEKIENRPSYEIANALKNTSKIASEEKREIIEIIVKSLYQEKYEVSADKIGQVLTYAQRHIYALGNLSGLQRKLTKEEEVKKSELELSLINSFQGSFGIRLGLATQRQIDIEGNYISREVSKQLINLFKVGGEENISEFRDYIAPLRKEILKSLKYFVKRLKRLESDLIFSWGSIGMEEEEIAKVSHSKVLEIEDTLDKEEAENPDLIEMTGKFIQAGIGERRGESNFIFEDHGGETIKGYIPTELVQQLRAENKSLELINGRYKIVTEKNETVIEMTGEIKIIYKLVEIEAI